MSGLYIHIPFCHAKCAYCDFYSTPRGSDLYDIYIDALLAEFDRYNGLYRQPFETLYIGGGTPSVIPVPMMRKLVCGLRERGVNPFSLNEFTVEANPEDVTHDWLGSMKRLGARRISMGIQSLNDNELRTIGRRHTGLEAIAAARLLHDSALDYSLDLIYGLPGQTLESWRESLYRTIALNPHHLSAYLLSYEPGTRLTAMRSTGRIKETDEDTVCHMYDLLISATRQAGYEHYEISNFSLPGHQAIHNSNYWNGTPYLGLGASAHSFDGTERRVNAADIRQYLAGKSSMIEDETEADRLNDYIVTALRTTLGISLEHVRTEWGSERLRRLEQDATPLVNAGALEIYNGTHMIIPENQWLTSDDIMRHLIQID